MFNDYILHSTFTEFMYISEYLITVAKSCEKVLRLNKKESSNNLFIVKKSYNILHRSMNKTLK